MMAFPSTDLDVIVEVYLGADPTDDPADWPAPTDLSSRLLRKPIQIRRGRGNNQKTAQAGACTLWLDNTDGALTPLLATSTYYPDWDLGVPLRVSVDNVGVAPPYVRHAGFVASIEAVMVPGVGGLNISAVRVTSAGVLRRLSQGAAVKSALRRADERAGPLAYWPMEDGSDATQVSSGLPDGQPMTGPSPSFTTGPPGSTGALDLLAGDSPDYIIGHVTLPSTTAFQVEFAAVSDSADVTVILQIQALASNLNINLGLSALLSDGTPHHLAAQIVQNGSNVDVTLYRDGVFSSTTPFTSDTITPTVNLKVPIGQPLAPPASLVTISHLVVFSSLSDPAPRAGAVTGYSGEQAHVRVERICGEEGIPYSGTASVSNECGPQPFADVVAVMQDAETVDHGMLLEDFAWGLDYLAMSQRVNLNPSMTIDLSTYRTTAGTQADVLSPVRDDARIRNEWTISRPGGSSAKASDTSHISKRGRYNDSADVNVADDDQLPDEAAWRVHEGTFDGLRYQSIPLDIGANL